MSKRDSKKLRANTAWEYNLEAKSRYRPRTSTGGDANEIQTSPRRSTNKINISGSMTTRASNKTKLPKFMFHSHAYSVFSSTGIDLIFIIYIWVILFVCYIVAAIFRVSIMKI